MTASGVARLCSIAIVTGLLGFLVLTALAASRYSGGTFCEPDADRYRFWGNFFCDLTADRTRHGIDNSLVAALANAGFFCFSLALGPFFWLLGALVTPGFQRAIRACGVTSAIATNVIAWTPSSRWPLLHVATVFVATIPALVAAAIAVHRLLSRSNDAAGHSSGGLRFRIHGRWAIGATGAAALGTGSANALGYAYAVAVHAACLPWLPALQKVVAISLLAWMGGVAIVGWAPRR